MSKLFTVSDNLKIGKVIEVAGTSIRVELDGKLTELTRSVDGRVYPIGQISSVIKIHYGHRILFAYVRMLRMKSDIEVEEVKIRPQDDSRILEADLFGEGVWISKKESFSFNRGVKTYPLPQQEAYLTTKEELQKLFESAEKKSEEELDPMLDIGSYASVEGTVCRANLNKLFGHHCAVLGSTGSGKSATVSAIIHSILDKKINGEVLTPRVVIIDPHGEYAAAFKDKAVVFRAYDSKGVAGEKAKEITLQLPYWLMSGEEFRSLVIGKTEHEATSQNNIIYKALAHARMSYCKMIEPATYWIGSAESDIVPDSPRPINGSTLETISSFDKDKPIPFKLSTFKNHIENEQMIKVSQKKWSKLPPSDSGRHSFDSILDKLRVLESDPRLRFIMKEYSNNDADLKTILKQFVGKIEDKQGSPIRIIDISGLPNEVAGPLVALIARLLFQYKLWQTREEREKDPVLLVCEEAHRYVPNKGEAEYEAAQAAIKRIAKEGRKYGLGLMLVSQRPSDVESTVLSQCNSWIVMRLTNSSDQEHVSKILPDSLAGFTKQLSSLARREAIFVGEAAAIPAKILIKKLSKDQLPDSNDIKFVDGWNTPYISDEDISEITDRWQNVNFTPNIKEKSNF